jgi:uncharacterized protein (TIGR02246 family)
MLRDRSADIREITQLFQKWDDALQSGDARNVAALYAPDAVLVPTFANEILDTPVAITAYFANLLHRQPSSKVISAHMRHFGQIAVHSGIYELALAADGPNTKLQARFTFVYCAGPEGWKIIEHHSSMLPQT